jgi:monofunctional biosynthetic peptidoglycan transglycosylase
MLARMFTGQSVDRRWIKLDDIASVVPQSVIMSEDGQFCSHRGVDWDELTAVIDDALDGEKTRGASTLPMQTVKNLFLWPQRSFIRKGFEIPYAIFADAVLPKHRIMEIYLNIAEWDEGIFGIEAASRHYFNRSASKLSRRQAALLTVTLPNPKKRNPAKPSRSLNRLAKIVEKRATQSGAYIKCLENMG